LPKRPYNTYIDSKEHKMSDTEIIVTTLVVAAIFAVKVWFINRFM
jgi:hypothetical protein